MALLPSDPKQRQRAILAILVIGAVAYATHTYLWTPRAAEIATLQTRLESLQRQNRAAEALTRRAGVAEVEQQLAMYRDHLVAVEGLIPLSEEVPDLLDAISAEAQRTGVDLTLLQPTSATQEDYYTRRTYELAVVGAYHDIGFFLGRVGSLPRIITPTGLNLNPRKDLDRAGNPRLEAKFSIETYVLPPQGTALEAKHAQ